MSGARYLPVIPDDQLPETTPEELADFAPLGRVAGGGLRRAPYGQIKADAVAATEGQAAEAAASAVQAAADRATVQGERAIVDQALVDAIQAKEEAEAAAAAAAATTDSIFATSEIVDDAFVVLDPSGQAGIRLSANGRVFRVPGATIERLTDGSLRITAPGLPLSLGIGVDRASIGGLEVSQSDEGGISLAEMDDAGNVSRLVYTDGRQRILGATFELDERSDVALAIVDPQGFAGYLQRMNGTPSLPGVANAVATAFIADEIARRDAKALALSAERARRYIAHIQSLTFGINHFLLYGQSLSSGYEAWPALTQADAALGLLMLGDSVHPTSESATTWNPFNGPTLQDMRATVRAAGALLDAAGQAALPPGDAAVGETPGEAALRFLRRAWFDRQGITSDVTRRWLLSSCGVGGQSIEELSKGASINRFNRLVSCATAAKGAASAGSASYGIVAVMLLQGENNYAAANGTSDRTTYASLMRQLIADITADVCTGVAGQTRPPAVFTYQTGGTYTRDNTGISIGLAQMDVAESEANVFLAAPSYPVTDKNGHLDANGSRWLGSQFGKVMQKVLLDRQDWRPLSPLSVEVRGRQVLITHHVPAPPLVWGTPYVQTTATEYASKGYEIIDGAGAAGVASAEIVGDATVLLTASRDLSGTVQVRYAGQASSGGGCLRDSDPTVALDSYVYQAGTGQYASADIAALKDKPYPLWNWCIAYQLTATPA